MNTDRQRTVAFTGHRSYRGEADRQLRNAIEQLYAAGKRVFLSGMAVGFDLAAAGQVAACRRRHPDIRLVAVVPFAGQERRFGAEERRRYEQLIEAADERIILSERYHKGCYAVRNDFLVERASTLVAWYGTEAGGTRYTVSRALREGREVWNLHPAAPVRIHVAEPELF